MSGCGRSHPRGSRGILDPVARFDLVVPLGSCDISGAEVCVRLVALGSGHGPLRGRLLSMAVLLGTLCLMPVADKAHQPVPVTVFEGARLIAGDGSAVIEDSVFIV